MKQIKLHACNANTLVVLVECGTILILVFAVDWDLHKSSAK